MFTTKLKDYSTCGKRQAKRMSFSHTSAVKLQEQQVLDLQTDWCHSIRAGARWLGAPPEPGHRGPQYTIYCI